jgi:hypothetical protein
LYAPVLAVHDDHQQDGDFNFDAPHVQDDFGLNLEAADLQNELQQMISKPQCNLIFFVSTTMNKQDWSYDD